MALLRAARKDEIPAGSIREFQVNGKTLALANVDGKIYAFQPDGVGGFHAYPTTGKEVAEKYPGVASQIAAMLGVDFKRLSRME